MSDPDEPAHRSHGWGEMDDGAEAGGVMPAGQQTAARWMSLQSGLQIDEVRRRLLGNVTSGYTLIEARSGCLIRWVRRGKVLIAELDLATWDAGTRIQVAVPTASGIGEKELDELRRHLESVLE